MEVTNVENQQDIIRKKVKKYFLLAQDSLAEGVCPTKDLLAPTLDKWSIFCLYNLAYSGTLRFNTLKKYVSGISARMLSVTLKKMESLKIVERTVYPDVPPKVEYCLTAFGLEFAEKILDLNLWLVDQISEQSIFEAKKS